MLYTLARFIFIIYLIIVHRWRIYGLENIPQQGPFVICSNHVKWIDPVVVGCAFPLRLKIQFMAKEEIFRNRFVAFILKRGAFPVNRQAADYHAIRRAFQLLKENRVIGMFPEGTRSKTGIPRKAQPGAALIASRDCTPVVPVGIDWVTGGGRPLTVRIGKPFSIGRLEYSNRKQKKVLLNQMSAAIMENITNLLPYVDNMAAE